jgi:ATP synthase protein I
MMIVSWITLINRWVRIKNVLNIAINEPDKPTPILHLHNDCFILRATNKGDIVKKLRDMQGTQRLLLLQLCLTILTSAMTALVGNATMAISAMAGGLVCIVPNACFASQLFKYHGARAAKKIVNGFYKGEAMKIFLSVALFALVFKYLKINPLMFFATYIAAQTVFWFAPLIFVKENGLKRD